MTKKIAINGFGRIGRIFFKKTFLKEKDFEIVAINDLGNLENLVYLLKYDSVYGKWDKKVEFDSQNLIVEEKKIKFFQIKNPEELPWKEEKIDVVIESSGVFESYNLAQSHLKAGAKKVIITAPAKDQDTEEWKTILVGVNDNQENIEKVTITSNGSCTTNAVAVVLKVLNEKIGIEKAVLSTTHAYTATQNIVDGPTKGNDYRRGRGGAFNISPSTTGAALSVTRALKELENKFDGIALRVPVICGSIADITFISKKETTVEEINKILEEESQNSKWQDIFSTTREQFVSSDILDTPYGGIVDLNFTKVIDKNLVKILVWYDNEAGYVSTLIKHLKKIT